MTDYRAILDNAGSTADQLETLLRIVDPEFKIQLKFAGVYDLYSQLRRAECEECEDE